MARKRDSKPEERKPERAQVGQPAKFPQTGCGCRCQRGHPRRQRQQRRPRRDSSTASSGTMRRTLSSSARALPDCPAPSGRGMPACACSSSIRTSTSAARCCTAAARSRSAAATRCSCGTSRAKATRRGSSRSPPLHKPEDIDRRPGLPVQGHHRLVGPRRRCAAPYRYNDRELHRAWADNCYGTRQFLIDNYVRFSRITRHAPDRRHIARQACDHLPDARRQDRHQGGNRHAQGRGNSGQELEPLRAAHHGQTPASWPGRARSGTAPRSRAVWSSARGRKASSSCSTGA